MLAGIQFYVRCYDPGFSSLFSHPSIRLLLKGIAKSLPKPSDTLLPITIDILHKLVLALRGGLFSHYYNSLLEAAFLMAFYGFLRPGEFTSDSLYFDSSRGLCFSDVQVSPNFFSIFLRHSKTDTVGKGVTISISKLDSPFCPHASMLRYLAMRPRTLPCFPLFLLSNYLPMSKEWFREHLGLVVEKCALSRSVYTGHSFRIGAATTAADRGLPDSSIKRLGRWTLSAFEACVRPDSKSILKAQLSLSWQLRYLYFATTGGGVSLCRLKRSHAMRSEKDLLSRFMSRCKLR
ncbi:hypothetical protein ACEWY4_024566 [Coilia grayii]|uniref:Uncharacterized protein n=1 Tax=Coilia grayii TaxID=363190 RepID=A0ABD1J0Q3_9TELE